MQATIGLQKDGSIAIEVDVALALLQWPFLTDISLVWAAASIFDPAAAPVDQDPSSAAATAAADALLMSTEPSPWLYFNAILRDSQVFIPVADPVSPTPSLSKPTACTVLSLVSNFSAFSQTIHKGMTHCSNQKRGFWKVDPSKCDG